MELLPVWGNRLYDISNSQGEDIFSETELKMESLRGTRILLTDP